MVTEGPIRCYPITKKVPCSSQPPPPSVLPPCSTSVPPSSQEKERKQKVLGLHHCLHHCDNLHIYLVIFSLFCLLLQSISPGLVCAAETCKEVQVVISEMTDLFFLSYFSCVKKRRGKGKRGDSLNQVIFLSFFYPVGKASEIGALQGHRVRMLGTPGWPLYRGDYRGQGEPQPLDTLLSLLWGCSDKWGSGHGRQGKVVALCSCDMAEPEYWLRTHGAGLIDGWLFW